MPVEAGPANGPAAGNPDGIGASVSVQSEARFRAEFANVAMAYNVFQTAREEGVRRVVMISSNHAADYYEALILDGKWDVVTPAMQERAVGYYGWAKATYEHLGLHLCPGRLRASRRWRMCRSASAARARATWSAPSRATCGRCGAGWRST